MKKTAQAAAAVSIALAAIGAHAQQQAIKPSAQVGVTTATASLPPTVTFQPLASGGRRMIVDFAAPRFDATVGRPVDAHIVVLKSDTWYCERADATVSTGAFATQMRSVLEEYILGRYRPAPDMSILANAPDLDAFAAEVLSGSRGGASDGRRVKPVKQITYTQAGVGPGEVRLNDCYSAQEMQAIKSEVARILGTSN